MPFGKHKGKLLSNVPLDYLHWLQGLADLSSWLREAVEAELEERRFRSYRRPTPPPPPPPRQSVDRDLVHELVTLGARQLALRYHPDRGGDVATMQRVNAAVAHVRAWLPLLL